jgi:cytochrome d ubiquinol oxidase subunit I
MEGQFETGSRAALHLFGWPDQEAREVKYGVAIPGMLSWLVHGDVEGEIRGLNELEAEWGMPPVWLSFQSYHLMVAIGMLFIVTTVAASFFRIRGTLFEKRWFLAYFVVAVIPAIVANEAGWVAAEVGRQPWIVYPTLVDGVVTGGLRTSEGLSEAVKAGHVMTSIVMFGLIYLLLFFVWIYVLNHKIQEGPDLPDEGSELKTLDFMGAAAGRASREASMTEAKSE